MPPDKPSRPAANATIGRQRSIYSAGLAGHQPLLPTNPGALETAAEHGLSRKAFAYVAGGAGAEQTIAYGLGIGGEQGVAELLANLGADFELTMALAGCADITALRDGTERVTRI